MKLLTWLIITEAYMAYVNSIPDLYFIHDIIGRQ